MFIGLTAIIAFERDVRTNEDQQDAAEKTPSPVGDGVSDGGKAEVETID